MKYRKVEDKLLDLYGISEAEARHHWFGAKYVDVLYSKKRMAEKLRGKLMDYPMMDRDDQRIRRISEAIKFNEELLSEVIF